MPQIGNRLSNLAANTLAGLGAVNWGLVEFADMDLLVDTLSLSGDVLTGVYGVIAIAGILTIYNWVVVEAMNDPLDG